MPFDRELSAALLCLVLPHACMLGTPPPPGYCRFPPLVFHGCLFIVGMLKYIGTQTVYALIGWVMRSPAWLPPASILV